MGLPQMNTEFALYARKGPAFFLETKALPPVLQHHDPTIAASPRSSMPWSGALRQADVWICLRDERDKDSIVGDMKHQRRPNA